MGSDKFAMKLAYSSNGNVTQQQWRQPELNGDLATYAYSYDAADRLLGANFTANGYHTNAFKLYYVQYDKNGNIKSYIRNNQSGGAGATGYMTMRMQANSNRIAYLEEGGNYTRFNTSYDANGNMIENELNGLSSVNYDWRNLPSQLMGNAVTMQYAYDGDGNRTKKKKVGGTELHYVRGADGQVLTVYQNDALTYQNIIAGGEMMGNYDGTQRRYFLKDHLGSIRTTVNQNGNVDGYDDYYPFGLVMPGRSSNSANPNDAYKFTGHELDDEANLNLYHANARGYDPVLGRFMQIDPMSHLYPSSSPFAYALNNPVGLIDPTGEIVKCTTREDCEKAAEDFNTVVEGAGITVEEATWEKSTSKWWNPFTWGNTKTVEGFKLSTEGSDFNFGLNENTNALYDVINTMEVEYFAMYESDNFVSSDTHVNLFNSGGGHTNEIAGTNRSVMYMSDNNRLGIPRAAATFHEIIGHGHPNYQTGQALRNLDIRIQNTLQYRLKGVRGYKHSGFKPYRLPTFKINLFE